MILRDMRLLFAALAAALALCGMHRGRLHFALGVDNALDRYYIEHLSFQRDPYRTGVRIPERTLYVNVSFAAGGAR